MILCGLLEEGIHVGVFCCSLGLVEVLRGLLEDDCELVFVFAIGAR